MLRLSTTRSSQARAPFGFVRSLLRHRSAARPPEQRMTLAVVTLVAVAGLPLLGAWLTGALDAAGSYLLATR
ncbi:hypothetical protein ASE95_02975 [Sphingomonas sp. Leaf231]|nr:hypothetical protein ASE95_02975 [Sphingomonas sp. Leaf231]